MFSSLSVRNYRLFLIGQIVSNIGTWAQSTAQDWLVLSLTGSATAVGVTVALQSLPMLCFGLYGGVFVDRWNKRRTLLATQAWLALTALTLATLIFSGEVQVWHVWLAAFVVGLTTVVDNPARQAFVSEIVDNSQLQNAVSLDAANFQFARLLGPALAGVMLASTNAGTAFLLNGLSFVAPLAGLMLMRASELHCVERTSRTKGQLREVLRYVAGRSDLLWTLVLVGLVGTFGFNFPVYLSAFADDVFHTGVGSYSLFNTMMGVGSLAGALIAARRGSAVKRVVVGSAFAFGATEVVASAAPSQWLFTLFTALIGLFGVTINVTANTCVQTGTAPAMRGRVMALYMVVFLGSSPIGAPMAGWIADAYGARVALAVGGGISAAAAIGIGFVLSRASRPRQGADGFGNHPDAQSVQH
ncbi:MFS transporter [Streptomyces sp. NL15-2K]|uniref:MFS transporter n=1 Tax=Streptomyces sp. NL15-2K TaxID=376149 RepID=UPI000F58AC4A|nr:MULTISPECIES: MFS transporter [Actinomycetes]WKX06043.1 MFS transporter [Kutzneria buriramensis]GCB52691.1 hypothetical protein SNL152K_10048 [Streptomyces sp. NL15-2K]